MKNTTIHAYQALENILLAQHDIQAEIVDPALRFHNYGARGMVEIFAPGEHEGPDAGWRFIYGHMDKPEQRNTLYAPTWASFQDLSDIAKIADRLLELQGYPIA